MKRFIIGITITGALFYVSALYKSTTLMMYGYAGAALLILAFLVLIYRMYTIRCAVTFPISIAECGKPLTVRILIENKSILPSLKFECLLERKHRFLKGRQKKWLQGGIVVSGNNSFDYSLVIEDYGSYEIRLKKVRIYDLTGLFYMHKTVRCGGVVQVLPNMQEIGVHMSQAVRTFLGEADVYDEFRPGDDHSELFQIREFRNGDKLQSMHWKLSAKQDALLVKEHSLPKACPVVFFLNYKKEKQRRPERVNAYLVILASISFSLMDAGCAHYAAWYSNSQKDLVRVRVDDEESLFSFLSGYLEETFQKQENDLERLYQEKYRGENYLFALSLDERLRLLKNGERMISFPAQDWEKKLKELELVL